MKVIFSGPDKERLDQFFAGCSAHTRRFFGEALGANWQARLSRCLHVERLGDSSPWWLFILPAGRGVVVIDDADFIACRMSRREAGEVVCERRLLVARWRREESDHGHS